MVRVAALSGKADDIRKCRFRNCGGEQAVCTGRWILSEPVTGGHYDWRIGTLWKWKGLGLGQCCMNQHSMSVVRVLAIEFEEREGLNTTGPRITPPWCPEALLSQWGLSFHCGTTCKGRGPCWEAKKRVYRHRIHQEWAG